MDSSVCLVTLCNVAFREVPVMALLKQQHDGEHDKLSLDYECLWSNGALILEEIESHFAEDTFQAQVLLSHILMVG